MTSNEPQTRQVKDCSKASWVDQTGTGWYLLYQLSVITDYKSILFKEVNQIPGKSALWGCILSGLGPNVVDKPACHS